MQTFDEWLREREKIGAEATQVCRTIEHRAYGYDVEPSGSGGHARFQLKEDGDFFIDARTALPQALAILRAWRKYSEECLDDSDAGHLDVIARDIINGATPC